MRFLPVFLDLQAGPVLLVGAGEQVRAKLRLLISAGARVRWFATDGNHDLRGMDSGERRESNSPRAIRSRPILAA